MEHFQPAVLQAYLQQCDKLTHYKNLMVQLYSASVDLPQVRQVLEERTGGWFVFGVDRSPETEQERGGQFIQVEEILASRATPADVVDKENQVLAAKRLLQVLWGMCEPLSPQRVLIATQLGKRRITRKLITDSISGAHTLSERRRLRMPMDTRLIMPLYDMPLNPGAEFK